MNIFTLLDINDITRNNIWPAILKQLINEIKHRLFVLSIPGLEEANRNKFEPTINSMNDVIGMRTLIILRLVCKKFKTIFTNDFYWEKIYKGFNPSPFYNTIALCDHLSDLLYGIISEIFRCYYIETVYLTDMPDEIQNDFFDKIVLYKKKKRKFLDNQFLKLQKRQKFIRVNGTGEF